MREIAVALLGLGTVGRAFARYVGERIPEVGKRVSVLAVADRSGGTFPRSREQLTDLLRHKDAGHNVRAWAPSLVLQDVPSFISALPPNGISILVEALPTQHRDGEPALGWLLQALSQGISVVTVDKGPVVHGLASLREEACRAGAKFAYSGTTGVTAPSAIAGCTVSEIQGVLNGTTNYILTEMRERSIPFRSALSRARELGIAEPDPSLDIEGWDTACKILILARTWMGADARLQDVTRHGIGPETDELLEHARSSGRRVRLIGRARFWQGRLRISVAPKLLGPDSPFFAVSGTSKAAVFCTAEKGEVFVPGLSGLDAISQTILNDVLAVASQGKAGGLTGGPLSGVGASR